MRTTWLASGAPVALALLAVLAPAAQAGPTKCSLAFDLQGWSVFYKAARGTGIIKCDTVGARDDSD